MYLRIGGFDDEPMKLPWYALDCFVLAKLCRQLFSIIKDNLPKEDWETTFPIKLSSLVCNNMDNASIIGSNLLGFNLGFYHNMRNFDSKGYATQVLGLEINPSATAHFKDLWEDYMNEEEVLRKDHSRLTLQKINAFRLKFKTGGVNEDGSDMIEPGWRESNEIRSSVVD